MTLKEKNMITDWLKENGNPKIEIQVLNEVVDKLVEERDTLLKQRDEFAIEFGEYLDSLTTEDIGTLSIKQLLEIFKKEKGL